MKKKKNDKNIVLYKIRWFKSISRVITVMTDYDDLHPMAVWTVLSSSNLWYFFSKNVFQIV